jgi:hypothetical protein
VVNYTVQPGRNYIRLGFEPQWSGGMHLYGFLNEQVSGGNLRR